MSTVIEAPPIALDSDVANVPRSVVVQSLPIRESDRTASARERLPLLDLLRLLAAHLIVWHHLSFYGPISTTAYEWLPGPIWALSEWGRCAVQVFFVVGGFVMARSLSQRGWITLAQAGHLIAKRYRRIGGPYVVLLVMAVAANGLAALGMDHASISAMPTIPQFLAHTVFLQDILGYEPLTAGIWYLAVDFQLGLLLLGLTMLSQRAIGDPQVGPRTWAILALLVIPCAAASLFWFNRDPAWEEWGIYFLGSYALGALIEGALSRRLPVITVWAYAGLIALALLIEWRLRLAVSLTIGLILLVSGLTGVLSQWPKSPLVTAAANQSYSLFLIHFPVCLLVNAVWSQFALSSPGLCLVGMAVAYSLSVIAAMVFHRQVERAFL